MKGPAFAPPCTAADPEPDARRGDPLPEPMTDGEHELVQLYALVDNHLNQHDYFCDGEAIGVTRFREGMNCVIGGVMASFGYSWLNNSDPDITRSERKGAT